MNNKKPKNSHNLKTKHGENLTVLDTRAVPALYQKGVEIKSESYMVLAQSGDHKCWFPAEEIETES